MAFGRSGESRTHGLLNPIQARYQTALHPEPDCHRCGTHNIIQPFGGNVKGFFRGILTFLVFALGGCGGQVLLKDNGVKKTARGLFLLGVVDGPAGAKGPKQPLAQPQGQSHLVVVMGDKLGSAAEVEQQVS